MIDTLKIATWGTLSGVLIALIMFFVLTRGGRSEKIKKKRASLIKIIIIASFVVGGIAAGYYILLLSQLNPDTTAHAVQDTTVSWKFPVVKFPITGTDPTSQTIIQSLQSLYTTPIEGLITLLLLTAIVFLVIAVVHNFTMKRRVEKGLEEARIAARNVFEDLQGETHKLAEAKAKDEALLESIGEGVVATNQDGNIIIINKVAENLLGFTSADIMGKPFFRAISLEDIQGNQIPDAQQPMVIARTLGRSTSLIYYFVRKDGTKFPVAITATPVLLDAKPIGAIVVFRDITKEREIEKLRTDFLSLASHQLRTPLSGTKWLIDTMRREILGSTTPKQKEYLDYIYQLNERMIKLVSEMLNVLVLEGGVGIIKKQEISVSQLCEELFVMTEPAAKNKHVTLRNAFKKNTTLFIHSDSHTLQNILESFISNAINYSQNGQEVVLNAAEESDAVVFSVQDTGIGIPKEEQKRIFERFYRASNAKEFKPDGTGLGLYTAFLLAQKISGKISFESEKNKGTTFYLRVPKKVDSRDDTTNS